MVSINRADYENNTKNLNFNLIARNYRASKSNSIIIFLIYVCERAIQRGFFQNVKDALFLEAFEFFENDIVKRDCRSTIFQNVVIKSWKSFPSDFSWRGEIWTHENVSIRYFHQVENVPYELLPEKRNLPWSMAFPKCHNHPSWTRFFQGRTKRCLHPLARSLNHGISLSFKLFSLVQIILYLFNQWPLQNIITTLAGSFEFFVSHDISFRSIFFEYNIFIDFHTAFYSSSIKKILIDRLRRAIFDLL